MNHNGLPLSHDPERFFKEVYGAVDQSIRSNLLERVGGDLPEHIKCLEQYGITKLSGLFDAGQVTQMQVDVASWRMTKDWNQDRQVGFDGGRRESYLPTSRALSEAVTNPAIWATITATFGQHPRLASVSTYSIDPIGPDYQERFPFQWHHDGSSEYGIRAMILISDVPGDGQAMRICPGTNAHQWQAHSARETQFDDTFANNFEQYVCSGAAGDVFIFNPHALHKGTRNASTRRDVTAAYFQPGIARSFALPGLHPDVVARLADYQRSIYRVGDEGQLPIDESTFAEALAAQRETMNYLAGGWDVPVEQIRTALNRSGVDKRIAMLGRRNQELISHVPPLPKEQVTELDITVLRQSISGYGPAYRAFLSSNDAPAYMRRFHTIIHDERQADFNGDLDLPVRMYNPCRDQLRDEALFIIRSRRNEPYIMEMASRLSGLTQGELADIDLTAYAQMVEPLAVDAIQLLGAISESPTLTRELEAYACFIEDIQDMLQRAYSVQLVRRTLLFAYLTCANLHGICSASVYDDRLVQSLAVQKERMLRQYAAMVVFDKLTQS